MQFDAQINFFLLLICRYHHHKQKQHVPHFVRETEGLPAPWMSWRRPTSTQAPELGEELYSWGDANCSASFSCLLSETGMVQLHHHRHNGHEQGNGSEAKHRI